MDWNRVEGNWKQVKGKVKEQWGKLTDDDLDVISGRRDQLEGKIQERYGLEQDPVRQDVDDWYLPGADSPFSSTIWLTDQRLQRPSYLNSGAALS
jgi:uncharacterized protein YjbJ (UPF0337 family)